jgi:histidinol-phosphate/aromatic aminotransferase/cobyric acid decarboxylase-like protein
MQIYPKYREDYKHACDQFIQAREDFEAELKKIPYLKVMPSQANYFFLEVLPPYKPKELCAILLSKYNILASACLAKKGIEPNCYMRIAVRNHGDNERFIKALKDLIIK